MLLDRLFRNLDLTLQAFAVCEVASGWRLALNSADWVTVHFVLSGSGRLRLSGAQMVPLAPHSLVLVPANRAHQMEVGDPVNHEARGVRSSPHDDDLSIFTAGSPTVDELIVACGRIQARYGSGMGLFDGLQTPLLIDFADSPQMADIFERLLAEERHRSATSGVMITALMNEALILVFRRICADPECPLPWLMALEDPHLARPLALMLDHPEKPHTLDTLATAAAMGRSAFVKSFGDHFGRSPMAYLRDTRMRRAAALLRSSDRSVDQVMSVVGYSSRSQFTRAFRRQFGATPAAFRSGPFEGPLLDVPA